MKMFEVDCGGDVYWIAARDESDELKRRGQG